MDFYKNLKNFLIILIIFVWVFSGSFQIWNNPSIPPKTQKVYADTESLSPDALLVQTNLSGTVSNIQDDPDSPDANWLTAIDEKIKRIKKEINGD
jgi:hypothetical protein